ncbi:Homoserine/homoserine lactone efflux protein [Pseudovibrio axinellae]|uniref:Homoserine/homoserine lactone efflux protein n=1 Tax=Pseudovibrio axinellae TaxID=989403 RepID=A0A165Z0X5_9HYPH|nr:LysE family translocator [Pseudovibrio axinellae]KZL19413.1 Homoserine/homoserine lactone efflux protein [Pseudovibrio axinellae]SER59236.1 Threonine/homoserine/homoserine lactone efflux protein [Pseudovibrio axinellae]
MSIEMIFALVFATAALVAIPGPNVALIAANTISHGFRFGAVTVLGTTLGVAIQLMIVVVGFSALLTFVADAFLWVKWLGAAYLIYLGIKSWRERADMLQNAQASTAPLGKLFWQGLLLAVINPKTLIFSAAFLPQFVGSQSSSYALAEPAMIYLLVILAGDLCWAALAKSATPFFKSIGHLRNKLTGTLFIGSGIGLALARIER